MRFQALLSNIQLLRPVDWPPFYLTPARDPRFQRIRDSSPLLERLASQITTPFGSRVEPSAILVDGKAHPRAYTSDALFAFRNCIALSTLIHDWRLTLQRWSLHHPLYSDVFDVYPVVPARNGKGYLTDTPAVLDYSPADCEFQGQCNPLLRSPAELRSIPTERLLSRLGDAFRRRFVRGRRSRLDRQLFNSLQLAFEAMRVPHAHMGNQYDNGVRLALWVSAIETLVHPDGPHVDMRYVVNELNSTRQLHPQLTRHSCRVVQGSRPSLKCTIAGKLYHRLYSARCRFLHGEPISSHSTKAESQLLAVAPILFRLVLLHHLDRCDSAGTKKRDVEFDFEQREYDEALLAAWVGSPYAAD
ncbi:MAG: hypothetical protein KJZ69_05860 [Phycisphaerales bacterium]|nr:hypothetical protein [Phycisphaerales bacterium]